MTRAQTVLLLPLQKLFVPAGFSVRNKVSSFLLFEVQLKDFHLGAKGKLAESHQSGVKLNDDGDPVFYLSLNLWTARPSLTPLIDRQVLSVYRNVAMSLLRWNPGYQVWHKPILTANLLSITTWSPFLLLQLNDKCINQRYGLVPCSYWQTHTYLFLYLYGQNVE